MPMYSFRCTLCGHQDQQFMPMAKAVPVGDDTDCPSCTNRSYRRQPDYVHSDMKEFHTPIDMYSIAMDNDEEIKKFMDKCPDVDVSLDPADPAYGIPIARSRKQKKAALEAAGFIERN